MEGHETMTIDQAILAVVHRIRTVIARVIAAFTTVRTKSHRQPFSSIVAKHFLEVNVPTCEPFLHDLSAFSFFWFLLSFDIIFNRIVVLYIGLIFDIFREQVLRCWVIRKQHSKTFRRCNSRYGRWRACLVIAMKSDSAGARGIWMTDVKSCRGFLLFLWGRHWKCMIRRADDYIYVLTLHENCHSM